MRHSQDTYRRNIIMYMDSRVTPASITEISEETTGDRQYVTTEFYWLLAHNYIKTVPSTDGRSQIVAVLAPKGHKIAMRPNTKMTLEREELEILLTFYRCLPGTLCSTKNRFITT